MSSISVAGSKSKTFTIVDLMDWALIHVNYFSHYIHASLLKMFRINLIFLCKRGRSGIKASVLQIVIFLKDN